MRYRIPDIPAPVRDAILEALETDRGDLVHRHAPESPEMMGYLWAAFGVTGLGVAGALAAWWSMRIGSSNRDAPLYVALFVALALFTPACLSTLARTLTKRSPFRPAVLVTKAFVVEILSDRWLRVADVTASRRLVHMRVGGQDAGLRMEFDVPGDRPIILPLRSAGDARDLVSRLAERSANDALSLAVRSCGWHAPRPTSKPRFSDGVRVAYWGAVLTVPWFVPMLLSWLETR